MTLTFDPDLDGYMINIKRVIHQMDSHVKPAQGRRQGWGDGGAKTPPRLRSSAVFHISLHFRILKMIATSGFLTALECTKFDFGRGSTPDPAGEAYSSPQTP